MALKHNFVSLVAWRFLRENKVQTALTIAGIAIGVMVIVFLGRLIDRLENNMVERVLSSQAHVVLRAQELTNQSLRDSALTQQDVLIQPRTQHDQYISNWQTIVAQLKQQPQVEAAAAIVSGSVFVRRDQVTKSVALLGVQPQEYNQIVTMSAYMLKGSFSLDPDQVLIGVELANSLGADVGDKIVLQNADGLADMLVINGIFDIGNRDLNRRWVFTSIKEAQVLLGLAADVSTIEVRIKEIFTANAVADKLQQLTGLSADSWMRTNKQMMDALKSQASSNVLIRSFLVLMIVSAIISVLVVTVVQKRKEIGILRAMGTTQGQIVGVFLCQGAMLGFIGSSIGVIAAFVVMQIFAYLPLDLGTVLPFVKLTPKTVVLAVMNATLVGMLAASMPARLAAKMNVIEAIQG